MIRKLLACLVVVVLGCGPNAATVIRNQTIHTANAAISTAVKVYTNEGLTCVEKATTRPEAERCVTDVERRWAPVWTAWDKFREVEDVTTAWCEFVMTFPDYVKPAQVEGILCPKVERRP